MFTTLIVDQVVAGVTTIIGFFSFHQEFLSSAQSQRLDLCPVDGNRLAPYFIEPKNILNWRNEGVLLGTPLSNR